MRRAKGYLFPLQHLFYGFLKCRIRQASSEKPGMQGWKDSCQLKAGWSQNYGAGNVVWRCPAFSRSWIRSPAAHAHRYMCATHMLSFQQCQQSRA